MELMLILLRQLIIMLLLMMVGYWLFYSGRISLKGNQELGNLLLYIILPCAIINSYLSAEFSRDRLVGLLWSFLAAILCLGLSILISRFTFGSRNKIEHFGTAFSNAGFMGIPIVQAVIGAEGVFYVAAFVALLNIMQWTYGVVVMSGKRDAISLKRLARNPIILSMLAGVLLYLLQIPIPAVIRSTISSLAGMNAPMAMIVLGVYLAQMPFKELLTEKYAYISTLFRLLVIPLCTVVLLDLIPTNYYDIRMAALIAACAPIGSNVAIFAQLNGLDHSRAVKGVCLSTVCSILTMPLIVGLAGMIWG